MNAAGKRQKHIVTKEERMAWQRELEKEFPGYLEMNEKLYTIVNILTGVRILYGLFYLAMSVLYEMPIAAAVINLFGPFFFYFWYTWMLKSGRFVAVMMLLFRGGAIVYGGVSLLEMSLWLPWPLLFLLTASHMIQFVEAVFCIYVLFQSDAAQTVRLNQELVQKIQTGIVASETLGQMAGYRNEFQDEKAAEPDEEDRDRSGQEERQEQGKEEQEHWK